MKKKMMGALGSLILSIGMLAGCGGQGDNLVDVSDARHVFDLSGYYGMDVSMEVTVADGGTISANLYLEGEGDVSHVKDMDMTVAGGVDSVRFSSEAWYDGDTVWSRSWSGDEERDWTCQAYEGALTDDIAKLFEAVVPDSLEAVALDAGYTATWNVSFVDIAPALEIAATGISNIAEYADMGALTATAILEEDLSLVSFVVESDGKGTDGFVQIVLSNIQTGDMTGLVVPKDVLAAASQVSEPPLDGKWNELRSDGYAAEVNWLDEGEDEQIDELVEQITSGDIGFNAIDVSYKNEMALMYNSGSRDEWNATMNVFRYETAEEAVAAMLSEYENVNPIYGPAFYFTGNEDTPSWVVFVSEKNEDIGTYVLMLGVQDNLFLECGGFDWVSDTKEAAMENLLHMIDVTGLDWGRSE